MAQPSGDIFQPISGGTPPNQISRRANHPVARLGIQGNLTAPLETNKFYANLFLGDQSNGVWTQPYSVSWSKGSGNAQSWGLAISHTDRDQLALGNQTGHDSVQFYINPIGIQSMVLSAAELANDTALTTDSLEGFSVNANLAPNANSAAILTFPLVQGMAFVTGIYKGATPLVQSSVFFKSVNGPTSVGSTYKYEAILEDGKSWLIYATPDNYFGPPRFNLTSSSMLEGAAGWQGIIQIAKNPVGTDGEQVFDAAAGLYPTSVSISGTTDGTDGGYTLSFNKGGNRAKIMLNFALPHHVQSFSNGTAGGKSCVQLYTTTKGLATAVFGDSWTMYESDLPTDMLFAPWNPNRGGSVSRFSTSVAQAINSAASSELNEDIASQTNLNSMYFSGKGLAKFASIVYATRDLAGNTSLAAAGLAKLKDALAVFVNNDQTFPLVYDESWKGVVSVAGYDDANADFGNTYYNDHHFHYGYFVYTAAVIAYLDPAWLDQGSNKAWVNMLVEDFANPVAGDYFPFSRAFDWYHGHSWAKGLYASADGKDQESTSEDAFATYGMKMWGRVIGDSNMEARGNLMLAVQARSFQNYFLMESNNTNQPADFINNKVTGILFENKADWATYFSDAWYCKEGIHMIPVGAPSALIRTRGFVQQEFDMYMSSGRIDSAEGGWKGILYANLALIDPTTAYNFFANASFDASVLDGGASRTWYLAYAAAMGGA